MTVAELTRILQDKFPGGKVQVRDLTGTSDHFHVEVVDPVFAGKSLIEQHKMVHSAVGAHLTTTIHALQIKTAAPKQGGA
jgi:stress-induced morphogen